MLLRALNNAAERNRKRRRLRDVLLLLLLLLRYRVVFRDGRRPRPVSATTGQDVYRIDTAPEMRLYGSDLSTACVHLYNAVG